MDELEKKIFEIVEINSQGDTAFLEDNEFWTAIFDKYWRKAGIDDLVYCFS